MNLFNRKLFQQRINSFEFPNEELLQRKISIITRWQTSLKDSDLGKTKERSIQGLFLQKFFIDILDFVPQTEGTAAWQLEQHLRTEVDATEPDGALGIFDVREKVIRAVIELKDAQTLLDKKQVSRQERLSPVEQAFRDASKFDRCDWIIVSNIKELRLYHKSRSINYFETFDVLTLHQPDEFKRFYFMLCRQNLIARDCNSLMDRLAKETTENEIDITKRFYADYRAVRMELFHRLIESNPEKDKKLLLEKTQKLLDRLIFIFFCEDTNLLLPHNSARECYERGLKSFVDSDERVWNEFKGLFRAIDKGSKRTTPPINAFDGGLFAVDAELDNLIIPDKDWKKLIDLAQYDFKSDLNVNILGHIFEQSIADIEAIKAELEGKAPDKSDSKRKKEGVYYTPEYITRLIVEESVGRYLDEHPERLETIRILDLACGSGAFLNQAHSYLLDQWNIAFEEGRLKNNSAKKGELFHYNPARRDSSILLNNLFGVDLNPESVEITKLALWLKTVKAAAPLENLEFSIRCGNSVIDDPAVAGERAFVWEKEFKAIMEQGGFDLIIGNPPYVRQEFFSAVKPYLEQKYRVYTGVSDLYVYFFERGLSLLKDEGYLSFIVSNKFLRTNYGKPLREYIQKHATIHLLIDFGDLQLFENATTYPCIILLQKKQPPEVQTFPALKINSLDFKDLGEEFSRRSHSVRISVHDERWILEADEVKTMMTQLSSHSVPLGEYVDGRIHFGIKTGYNKAFVIGEKTRGDLLAKEPSCEAMIKPFLKGKDVKRFQITWGRKYLLLVKDGLNLPALSPAIFQHLLQFKEALLARSDKGQEWYQLRACSYCDSLERPKIIYPIITQKPNFAFDTQKFYSNDKSFIIPVDKPFLIAILNSKASWFWFEQTLPRLRGGFFETRKVFMERFPIPLLDSASESLLAEKVQQLTQLTDKVASTAAAALELLAAEYRLPNRLRLPHEFHRLGWNQFAELLEKQKIKISLAHKEELHRWFLGKRAELQSLEKEIEALELETDRIVYELYELTREDIVRVEAVTRQGV